MAETLTLRILVSDWPLDAALALARGGGILPGVDVVAVPAGLDADRLNHLLAGSPPAEGTPVMAVRPLPATGVAVGTLGMLQQDEGGHLGVLVGEAMVPFDGRDFHPAFALTYLALQRHAGRFRRVLAVSGPGVDLRYAAVAARAATAEVIVLGTPDQVFPMVGPRDAEGVPVSPEFRVAVSGGGHRLLRVVEDGGATLAEVSLQRD